ncbi:MAG TPA: serine/threonine-protein kinase [Kofleriaceae bacterium]|nr:serine/threonine-protein kinase [Kofleriaceae bacterium]
MLVRGASAPERLGRYAISSHLASGGMAEIYLATAPDQREPVVVKVITRERATDQNFIQMFLDEARLAATLNHPNIARLLEVGKDGQVYFIAMELVRGETVRAILEKNARAKHPVPYAVVLGIAAKVAQALHHAHERKGLNGAPLDIVHRDVTPANVMVGHDGIVKLLDFGIARGKGRSMETSSGTVKGKFAYMAPEQCLGKKVDRRADVFSVGILLYELSTLRRAFRAETDYETLQKIVKGEIAPPSSLVPDYPPALEALIQRAMSVDLEQRFQTAAEIEAAIEAVAVELGGIAGQPQLRAFMAERFPEGAAEAGAVIVEEVEPAIPRTRTPSAQPSSGAVPSFFPSLVPAPPREQRITGGQSVLSGSGPYPVTTPTPTPAPPMPMPTPTESSPFPGIGPAPVQKTMLGHLAPPGMPSPMPTPDPLAGTPPAPVPVPAMLVAAGPVSLPAPPQPDRGLPWALPVALVAIAVVTLAVIAAILLT